MDCSSITDFQQSTAIRIAKKFRNLHIGMKRESSDKTRFCVSHEGLSNGLGTFGLT